MDSALSWIEPTDAAKWEAIDAHDGKLSVSVSGDRINVNKQGNYTYTLKAKDKSNNQTTRSVTIIVEPDVEKPVINKVTITPNRNEFLVFLCIGFDGIIIPPFFII